MGGPAEIQLFGEDESSLSGIAQRAINETKRIEKKYSRYLEDSIVSQINRSTPGQRVSVDSETAALLNYAFAAFQQSDGLFDISSGPLRKVWDFSSGTIPSQADIDEILPQIGSNSIEWDDPDLCFTREGMQIDLGGIGKEYGVDRAAMVLEESGVQAGLVNLAGDLRIIGERPDQRPWNIGITDPRNPESTVASIALTSGAIATSGDYQRYFEKDGKRYCHLLNPKTGWPVQGFRAVTVLAPSCLIAGTTASIAMLLGEKRGESFLNTCGLPSMRIDSEGKTRKRGLPSEKPKEAPL
ncbi:MAG: FAD:protein FMN transferase [Bdellovibrionales bacterium]|nr:FAD:protein FMN transferase [Bdellovibrionales bacterium]